MGAMTLCVCNDFFFFLELLHTYLHDVAKPKCPYCVWNGRGSAIKNARGN